VQVLQNRLNDAVLEVLCGMLGRNPMCKLTPDDVHFIQRPGEPADIKLEVCKIQLQRLKIFANHFFVFCSLPFSLLPWTICRRWLFT
jgi:hypothetical protein